jgi:lysozyme
MQWRKPPEIIPRRRKERDLFFDGRYSGNGTAVMYPATSDGRVIWGRGRRVNVMEILDGVSAPAPRQNEPKSPPSGKASFWSWLFGLIGKILRGGK